MTDPRLNPPRPWDPAPTAEDVARAKASAVRRQKVAWWLAIVSLGICIGGDRMQAVGITTWWDCLGSEGSCMSYEMTPIGAAGVVLFWGGALAFAIFGVRWLRLRSQNSR